MRIKRRIALAVLLVSVAMVLNGCLFNLFQTARMLGSGNVAVTIGSGLMDVSIDDDPAWALTPQARIGFGLSDKIDLGLQTGALVPLSTGDFGWLGAKGDLKFSVVDDPETFSLAMGVGAGNGIEFLGWGVFGEIFFDVNSVLPIFFAYQPTIPISGELTVLHHGAMGLRLKVSETASILLQVDVRDFQLFSFGLALEIGL